MNSVYTKIGIVLLFFVLAHTVFSEDIVVNTRYNDGKVSSKIVNPECIDDGTLRLKLKMSDYPDTVASIDVIPDFARAKAGDAGFYVSSFGEITKFIPREGNKLSFEHWKNIMPIHGSKTPAGTYLSFVRNMRFGYTYKVSFDKTFQYSQFITFDLKRFPLYEDIVIDFIKLPDSANYVQMAHWYRHHRLENDGLKPLRDKIKKRPELEYCINAPYVRFMMGMKPVIRKKKGEPNPMMEQTPETEPKMNLVNTFDDIGIMLEELKNAGVGSAQICLVGWNQKGHDGRYPQLFPVEESLGGESALRELIKKGQSLGYQMTCHTCVTDAYKIADCWDENYIAKNRDGSLNQNVIYSGGMMYNTCLKQYYKIFPEKDFAKLSEIGFHGLHYIDVLSAIYPFQCFDKKHSMTPSEGVKYAKKIFRVCNKHQGGSLSEGGIDHSFDVVDGCLWVYAYSMLAENSGLLDALVPFWNLVYNGIVLNTPNNKFTRPCGIDPVWALKFVEFGGRPRCEFAPALHQIAPKYKRKAAAKHASKIRGVFDEFQKTAYLQTEFFENHRELKKNVTISEYSDGSQIVCNYDKSDFEFCGAKIKPLQYAIFKCGKKTTGTDTR